MRLPASPHLNQMGDKKPAVDRRRGPETIRARLVAAIVNECPNRHRDVVHRGPPWTDTPLRGGCRRFQKRLTSAGWNTATGS